MNVFFTFVAWYVFFKLADHLLAAKGYGGTISDHFDGKHFYSYGINPEETKRKQSFGKLLKWMLFDKHQPWEWRNVGHTPKPKERIEGKELVVTFVNHATLLIQTEGKNIITDPVWSKRVSPFTFVGPKRFQNPGLLFEDLPMVIDPQLPTPAPAPKP